MLCLAASTHSPFPPNYPCLNPNRNRNPNHVKLTLN